MIDTFTDKWIEFTKVNNNSFEILDFGKVKTLIFKDFLKYPDQLRSFVDQLKFDSTCLSPYNSKPGKTYIFHPDVYSVYAKCITDTIKNTFKCDRIITEFYAINCFNGDMVSHNNFPHTDSNPPEVDVTIAANIGLTKNLKGGTGFWSYRDKINVLDMNPTDVKFYVQFLKNRQIISEQIVNEFIEYLNSNPTKKNTKFQWNQIENEGDWKLEYICPLEYNSLVLYSTLDFHNPYIKPNWYLDEDRVTISGFFDVDPESIHHECILQSSVSNLWKMFRLDTVHNIKF